MYSYNTILCIKSCWYEALEKCNNFKITHLDNNKKVEEEDEWYDEENVKMMTR